MYSTDKVPMDTKPILSRYQTSRDVGVDLVQDRRHDAHSETEYFSTSSGNNIAYQCYGRTDSGRLGDLVFFNGLFASGSIWKYQYRHQQLLDQFRLVVFDYRCQGQSSQVLIPFTLEDVIDDAAALFGHLELKRPSFIGHSLGGILLQRLAVEATAKTRNHCSPTSMVLVNTGDRIPVETSLFFGQLHHLFRQAATLQEKGLMHQSESLTASIFLRLIKRLFSERYLEMFSGFESELVRRYIANNRCARSVVHFMDAIFVNKPIPPPLGTPIHSPMLVITGRDDTIFPVTSVRSLLASANNAIVHVFDRTGHSCMMEQKARFNSLLTQFLISAYVK